VIFICGSPEHRLLFCSTWPNTRETFLDAASRPLYMYSLLYNWGAPCARPYLIAKASSRCTTRFSSASSTKFALEV
jgi:hypothetical protein